MNLKKIKWKPHEHNRLDPGHKLWVATIDGIDVGDISYSIESKYKYIIYSPHFDDEAEGVEHTSLAKAKEGFRTKVEESLCKLLEI